MTPGPSSSAPANQAPEGAAGESAWTTPAGIPVRFRVSSPPTGPATVDLAGLRLHLQHARLGLLRGFDQLLCLDGLASVEHLPHQIETVRKVLRHFRGRVLLADEVGLGKTIEACLLLREYLLRGLVKRVLILVPTPLVSQWREDCNRSSRWSSPCRREPASRPIADTGPSTTASLRRCPLPRAQRAQRGRRRPLGSGHRRRGPSSQEPRHPQLATDQLAQTSPPVPAHGHARCRTTCWSCTTCSRCWSRAISRREPDFKKQYVRRGNPRDPLNRERLRSLLGEVMIRNTRSLVQMDLPPRYAHTLMSCPTAMRRSCIDCSTCTCGEGDCC